ncbi:MAG: TRAM domain-containing protein, partial [Candidatus Nanohaloarchaea archaeon]|nr:TRAM domain-containing protein [Candidatus Nanohaloarchaea archaeon]
MAFGDDDEGGDKPVEEGETYEVEIEDLGSKGDGIARVDNFVVFVPETEVGERVEVEINSVGRKFAFGDVVDRLGEAEDVDTAAADEEEPAEEQEPADDEPDAGEDTDLEEDPEELASGEPGDLAGPVTAEETGEEADADEESADEPDGPDPEQKDAGEPAGEEDEPAEDDGEEDPRRTGSPRTVARHDDGLSTEIGRSTEGTGRALSGRKRGQLGRLRREHRRARFRSKAER